MRFLASCGAPGPCGVEHATIICGGKGFVTPNLACCETLSEVQDSGKAAVSEKSEALEQQDAGETGGGVAVLFDVNCAENMKLLHKRSQGWADSILREHTASQQQEGGQEGGELEAEWDPAAWKLEWTAACEKQQAQEEERRRKKQASQSLNESPREEDSDGGDASVKQVDTAATSGEGIAHSQSAAVATETGEDDVARGSSPGDGRHGDEQPAVDPPVSTTGDEASADTAGELPQGRPTSQEESSERRKSTSSLVDALYCSGGPFSDSELHSVSGAHSAQTGK